METINELKQKIENINKEGLCDLKKVYEDFIKAYKPNEYAFEWIIQHILLQAFDNKYPNAFYICYATGELYDSPEVQLNGNLYRIQMNLANGDMKPFVKAHKLGDANFYIDKIDIYSKRKQMVHDWFIAAFSNDPEEIKTVENYEELHKNLTENILYFACKMICSHM